MAQIRKVLGTMAFGGALKEAESHEMIKVFSKLGCKELDTALMYQSGKTEKIMGKLKLCQDVNKIHIATKANPTKGFKCEDIVNQLNTSLASLNVDCVDIFYLHWPDHNIPIEETLKGVHQLYKEGKFKEFGLSNYASWETAEIYYLCKQNGYVLPTVYQGMYNALTRDIEAELIPALRKFGLRFYVYNPLAGGMLSGRYNFNDTDERQPTGRFFATANKDDLSNKWNKAYRDRYWRDAYKTGIEQIEKVLDATYDQKVPLYEAAMRWLTHHSEIRDNDGIIIGASKLEHLQSNVEVLNGDPLHEDVVKAFDRAWDLIKSDCPKYNR